MNRLEVAALASLFLGFAAGRLLTTEPELPNWKHPESGIFDPPELELPAAPPEHVVATAYCACPVCCGKWAEFGLTASGTVPAQGRTIASDWAVFPEGTCLALPGLGPRTVEDTGRLIKGARVDVFFESHDEALQFGRRTLEVKPC